MIKRWNGHLYRIALMVFVFCCMLLCFSKNTGAENYIEREKRIVKSIPKVKAQPKDSSLQYDKKATKKVFDLLKRYDTNNTDESKRVTHWVWNPRQYAFMNRVMNQWVSGNYSRKKALRLLRKKKFIRTPTDSVASSRFSSGTIGTYYLSSLSENDVFSAHRMGKYRFDSSCYLYVKVFWDKNRKKYKVYVAAGTNVERVKSQVEFVK